MNGKYRVVILMLLLLLRANLAGAEMKSQQVTPNTASPSATPPALPATPMHITAADLAKLRWIEGSWRGTGGGVPTFYERYKFENDATLVVETLTDETASKVSDESRFELKDGYFSYGTAESGSVASALDDSSITFAPLGKSRNFFRWQRETDNSWKALLNWTDKNGAPKERVYLMERLPGVESKKP